MPRDVEDDKMANAGYSLDPDSINYAYSTTEDRSPAAVAKATAFNQSYDALHPEAGHPDDAPGFFPTFAAGGGSPYGGPAYTSGLTDLSTRLSDPTTQLNTKGFDEYSKYALRDPSKDPNSAWGGMMHGRQQAEEVSQRDRSAAEGAGALAQARSNLAQRGGLTGGAAERMGTSGARDQMMRNQDVARAGQQSRFDIDVKDEDSRMGALAKIPGMALANRESVQKDVTTWADMFGKEQALGVNQGQFATNAAETEARRKQDYDLEIQRQKAQQYAADQVSAAVPRG